MQKEVCLKRSLVHFSFITTVAFSLVLRSIAHEHEHSSSGQAAARESLKDKPGDHDAALADANAGGTNRTASGWVKLGDEIMQKSREKSDAAFFERARRAYQSALAQDAGNEEAMVGLAWVHNTRHEFSEG